MVEQVFYSVSDNQERPPLPETASPAYQKLIQDCWAPNPETRPAFTEICARLRELVGSNAPGSRAGSFTEAMCAQNGIPSGAQSPSVGLSPPGSPVQRSELSFTLGNGSPVANLESPRRRNSFSLGAASAAATGEESPGRDRGATVAVCESGDGSPTGERSPRSQAPWGVVNGLHHQARAHKSRFSYVGPRIVTPGREVLSE
jgi:hypothetical protein